MTFWGIFQHVEAKQEISGILPKMIENIRISQESDTFWIMIMLKTFYNEIAWIGLINLFLFDWATDAWYWLEIDFIFGPW